MRVLGGFFGVVVVCFGCLFVVLDDVVVFRGVVCYDGLVVTLSVSFRVFCLVECCVERVSVMFDVFALD